MICSLPLLLSHCLNANNATIRVCICVKNSGWSLFAVKWCIVNTSRSIMGIIFKMEPVSHPFQITTVLSLQKCSIVLTAMAFCYCVLNGAVLYTLSQFSLQTATKQYNNALLSNGCGGAVLKGIKCSSRLTHSTQADTQCCAERLHNYTMSYWVVVRQSALT